MITSVANQLVAVDNDILRALESRITGKTGLRPNRSKPDYEFWLVQRSEGHGFFSLRLSHHKAYDKILQKGELRPELANVLCRLSDPKPKELFLDPFCGSVRFRSNARWGFPRAWLLRAIKMLALSNSCECGSRISAYGNAWWCVRDDALHLTRYQDESIHAIVTDPPWGHFVKTDAPIADFYRDMLNEFVRLLRPKARLVLLTAETKALESAMERN